MGILSFGPGLIIVLLGCFLLLAAIVGGGLEIKEIKIPKIEKTPRLLTGFLGLMLMMCGTVAGFFSFMQPFMTPTEVPAAPTVITQYYIPDTGYIAVDKVQLPHETGISDEVEQEVATLIVDADKAEILANYYQDDSYLTPYYAGYALQQLQQNIETIRQSGYIFVEDIDLDKSYYVNMELNNNILSIDECEYWKTSYYDPSTGNLVDETDWTLVPQTISIELVNGEVYITSIAFYQNNAFCT